MRACRIVVPLAILAGCSVNRGPNTYDATPPADLRVPPGGDLAGSPPGDSAMGDSAMGCATATYAAKQAPAAMLVLLDKSENMSHDNKWVFAAQAIVQAIDQDVFDSMSVGLYASPSSQVKGPACALGLAVSCGVPAFPQVDLKLAGSSKSSDPNGVRHDIKQWLTTNSPDAMGVGEANPLYDGAKAAMFTLQNWNQNGKRILLVVTAGAISCTSLSKPLRPAFYDCNTFVDPKGCPDWEDPNNLVTLFAKANQDLNTPIETFIVGVPGAETTGQVCPSADNPPYHMRLALSAMAYAGSPKFVPQTCTGKTFSKTGGDPTTSCHFDLTQGNFNAKAVSDTISAIRGKVLGCAFELPQPDGGMIDKDTINVSLSVNGGADVSLYRRKDPNNPCQMDGCWDYNKDGKIELIGKACTDVSASANAKVKIVVGCATIIG